MSNVTPSLNTSAIVTASASGGSSVFDLRSVDRAALQLVVSGASLTTSTITLTVSLDGTNYIGFAVAKTLAVSGATNGWFDLGQINYPYLKVSWTAPGAGVITIVATTYLLSTRVQQTN